MSIEIRKATTPYEISGAARLRHVVFVEEESYYHEQNDAIILDQYDILPTTANFIALVDNEIIGTIRFTQNSCVGTPADSQFDYRPCLPYFDDRIIRGSMFCVRKVHRGNPQIARGLLWLGMYWGICHNATHVLAPINPVTVRFFSRAGFKAVDQKFICQKSGLPTLPMLLKLSDGCEAFLEFVKKQQTITLVDTFARKMYEPKEQIIRNGESTRSFYFIIEGRVRVTLRLKGCEEKSRDYGPGEIFSEEALLATGSDTVNIIATNAVNLMVLDENNFRESVLQHSAKSFDFFHTMSKSLEDTQRLLLTFAALAPNAAK